jgi:hypothetical protein
MWRGDRQGLVDPNVVPLLCEFLCEVNGESSCQKKNRYMRRRRRRPQLTQPKKTADDDDGTTVMIVMEFLLFTYVQSHRHR